MATAHEAISGAQARLKAAYFGLKDMDEQPTRYQSGLMNAVVFGRMVTLSLQNMRNDVESFDAWYEPHKTKMKDDPVMRFFIELRNKIEKQVGQHTSTALRVSSFSAGDIPRPAPPYAVGFIVGHSEYGGASGWKVRFPDGQEDFYPVSLPAELVKIVNVFREAPPEVRGVDAKALIAHYLRTLSTLVEDARKQFLG
ncbi:hypothetical protein [Mesorhizobium japonicum]|uniref:hypothetical protein n=1 Tax=Mesorhizobium japonicum TaxID=2066070 RepID=UPI0005CAEF01|nr:hypothetical protein [Mesorhizobium japonicum]